MGYIDIHRHDECSTYDGFGKPEELAQVAKENGQTALGISNHGNTNSLVRHYFACKEAEIKPIMGVEGYFLPVHKPQDRGYHLCLFAKNLKGYENLNTLQFEGEKQKYYNAIYDFKMLDKYSDGIICTSACVSSYISQAIKNNEMAKAEKAIKKFVSIFGDDFYLEIQPYKIDNEGTQENINYHLMKFASKLKVKCIFTSDSHMGRKEDIDSYLKMHEIAKHPMDDKAKTYGERYIPTEKEIVSRFKQMHGQGKFKVPDAKTKAREMILNLEEIEAKVEEGILEELPLILPQFDECQDSFELLKAKVKAGLIKRGKNTKQYRGRALFELDVIRYHSFQDYFLMVADYTQWAKAQGIVVGAGRGSGCNCLVNYALYITDVDPILFDLDFNRFLRKDKKKMPDIDLDFETERRQEVIQYLLDKYPNNAAQICSYGLYRVDNLIRDLSKVCGLYGDDDQIKRLKALVNNCMVEGLLDFEMVEQHPDTKFFNYTYDNIIKHFLKLYNKISYIGTHAAGVAITGDNILKYTAIRIDAKTGKHFTNYDLNDMEKINVIKFDILGLTTMSSIGELRRLTGIGEFNEDWVNDPGVLENFNNGNTSGVFQFEKASVQDLLVKIGVNSFDDIIAANAMNRPGSLSLRMPDLYAANKQDSSQIDNGLPYSQYIENTYGCVIYQEQVQAIAVNIGGLEWSEADKIMKMTRGHTEKEIRLFEENYQNYMDKFKDGAAEHGLSDDEAFDIFDKFFNYSFNKGHSTGYSLISVEEMYYKTYYPSLFWYVKLKYCNDDKKIYKFLEIASEDTVIFLPHVNYSADFTIRKLDGEYVIQQGLSFFKNVGAKAAAFIEEERKTNGVYTSYDDFYDRCKNRIVTSRVVDILKESGALDFNKKAYIKRVTEYNTALNLRNQRK